MVYELTEIEGSAAEPVSLAEVKAYMRIDADYASEDNDLSIIITTARTRLEQYLNVGIAQRDVQMQWYGGSIKLPLSPINSVTSVSDKDGELGPERYKVSGFGNGTLAIIGQGGDCSFFYTNTNTVEVFSGSCHATEEVYTAIYNCGYETLPKLLKQAILAECDYLYKLKGLPATDLISPNASRLAAGYSKNLTL